ncbi:MAG: tripartite tricarboxylate transporter TctB family protein [Rhodobacteraceae bacterium]|nr:tripartite tricarboxylate transporter TctB family protein [Paracoccaceae bacterium]
MPPPDETADTGTEQARRLNFNSVFGGLFVALSAVLLLIIPDQIEKPLIIFAANQNDLKPSLFPQLVAVGFGGLGIWLFFKSFSIRERNELRGLRLPAIVNISVTLLAMLLYGPLMVSVGFVVASALLIGFLSTFFGNRNYLLTAAIAVAVPVTMFFVFTKLLATYLPPFPIDTVLTRLYLL